VAKRTGKPVGRPSTYTREVADRICERIAAGESVNKICSEPGMPDGHTFRQWVMDDIDGISPRYTRARDIYLDIMADETLMISDTPLIGEEQIVKADGGVEIRTADMLGHRRLRVDTRKWYLSKLAPKRYGDKLDVQFAADENLARLIIEGRKRLLPPESESE